MKAAKVKTQMNAENYLEPCESLLEEIVRYSPVTSAFLEQIRVQFGSQLAFYAAFVIICLEARVQQEGFKAVDGIRLDQLRSYTFFDMVDQKHEALDLFNKSLLHYQRACQRRFAASA